jgi:hypothetical protein
MVRDNGTRCPNCLAWVDTPGRRRRCPNCGNELEAQPLPHLPPGAGAATTLEEPAYAAEEHAHDTAPLSEFLAAGTVVLGLFMMIGGAFAQAPVVMIAGFVVMLVVTGCFAIFGKDSSLRRTAGWFLRWPSPSSDKRDRYSPPDNDRSRPP